MKPDQGKQTEQHSFKIIRESATGARAEIYATDTLELFLAAFDTIRNAYLITGDPIIIKTESTESGTVKTEAFYINTSNNSDQPAPPDSTL